MQYFSDNQLNGLAWELRSFAEEQARARNLVFWNILRNKAIVSICKALPRTIEELHSPKVLIGKKTIENYGQAIIRIVNEWCKSQENNHCNEKTNVTHNSLICLDEDGVMIIKQGGFYYNVSGNDALILHKYLGYKLFGVKAPRTGFPVSGQDTVLKRLDKLSIDYDVLNQAGETIVSKRFENNRYEIINDNGAMPTESEFVPLIERKKPFKERVSMYIDILQGLSENVDVVTGEVVEGLSDDVKLQLFEMAVYFDDRLKSRERQDSQHPNRGQRWSPEEDEQLLAEYSQGVTIKELGAIHGRSTGAIRSRLLNLNVIR